MSFTRFPRPGRSRRAAALPLLLAIATWLGSVTACDAAISRPSGQAMPRSDLHGGTYAPRGWTLVFSDDFTRAGSASPTGALPDGKWWGYYAGTRTTNSANGVYDSARTVSTSGGLMRYTLHSAGGTAYAAVQAPTLPAQRYGMYSVRYRYEPGSNVAGFKSVWMLWPDSNRWGEGEIDFNEYDNAAHRTYVRSSLHEACGRDSGCPQVNTRYSVDPTSWHTGTVIWTPGLVRTYIDGHLIGSSTTRVPSTPMHLLLQTEASSYGPIASPRTVVKIDVDWVVVYRRR